MKRILKSIYNWIVNVFSSKNNIALNELSVEEDSTSECTEEICERPHVEVEEKKPELEVQQPNFSSARQPTNHELVLDAIKEFNAKGVLPTQAMVEFRTGVKRQIISSIVKSDDAIVYKHTTNSEGLFTGRGMKYLG